MKYLQLSNSQKFKVGKYCQGLKKEDNMELLLVDAEFHSFLEDIKSSGDGVLIVQ